MTGLVATRKPGRPRLFEMQVRDDLADFLGREIEVAFNGILRGNWRLNADCLSKSLFDAIKSGQLPGIGLDLGERK